MTFQTFEHTQGTGGPVILWFMYPHKGDELNHTLECIEELVPEANFTLIAIQVKRWNEELSPWSHEAVDDSFTGEGVETKKWLMEEFLPKIECERPIYLMGYSLAGLFALWTLCEEDIFAGAMSCSGSTWYPDFIAYLEKCAPENKNIYLSLGGKESKTKDPLMATVGTTTREALEILKKRNTVIFEENAGGHFADSGKRLAKAVKWIDKKIISF